MISWGKNKKHIEMSQTVEKEGRSKHQSFDFKVADPKGNIQRVSYS